MFVLEIASTAYFELSLFAVERANGQLPVKYFFHDIFWNPVDW